MATTSELAVRRVVPRWRTFKQALVTGELDPSETHQVKAVEGLEFLRQKEEDWHAARDLFTATDLIGAAHVLGSSGPSIEAAEFVLSQGLKSSALARNLAADLLGAADALVYPRQPKDQNIAAEISVLKQRRIVEPKNAFVWADLARLYILLGLKEAAKTPIRVALALAPFDRFILRSATRYYLHVGRSDEALKLLRRTERTPTDPWLIAAELAVSAVAEKSPKFTKQAEALAAREQLAPFHTSEMLAALASLEMWNGNRKRARRLFTKGIAHPTENALAQTIWASRDVGLDRVDEKLLTIQNAFEAQGLAAENQGDWQPAFESAKLWANDESFSSRPYAFGSWIAATFLANPEGARKLAREGLRTNPGHPGLVNNLAFSLVAEGKTADAQNELDRVDWKAADGDELTCLYATQGLVKYRSGFLDEGRSWYEKAIALASSKNLSGLKLHAQLYMAREEALARSPTYRTIFDPAFKEVMSSGSVGDKALALLLKNEIENIHVRKAAQETKKNP